MPQASVNHEQDNELFADESNKSYSPKMEISFEM